MYWYEEVTTDHISDLNWKWYVPDKCDFDDTVSNKFDFDISLFPSFLWNMGIQQVTIPVISFFIHFVKSNEVSSLRNLFRTNGQRNNQTASKTTFGK